MEPQESQQHSQKAKLLTIIVVVALILGIGYVFYKNSRTEKPVDNTLVGVDYSILGVKYDDLGPYFVHAQSLQVLYTTTADCTGTCLENWIPYEATDMVALGNIFTEEREDNSALQYTWKGERLYTYTKDTWEYTLGDGVGGVWNIARP